MTRDVPCDRAPSGEGERFAVSSSGEQRAAEAVGLRGVAKGFLPYLVTNLPSHPVSRDLRALIHFGPVDPDVVGRAVVHQAASREASQRWYSDRRMRKLPFGQVMHLGAPLFSRHS